MADQRSIPERDMEIIKSTWAGNANVQRLAVKAEQETDKAGVAADRERALAIAVRDSVQRGELPTLSASAARIATNLMSCIATGPYGAGVEWLNVKDWGRDNGYTEGHVRNLLLWDKMTSRVITRPKHKGRTYEQRWIAP